MSLSSENDPHTEPTVQQTAQQTPTQPAAEQTHIPELAEDALAPAADMPIRLPSFEGPLDLLLFLIRRNEIDIYDIPIESVTKQYMEVIHSMKELNLEVAGDFFVMAATLMYIKSRMLLPTNEQAKQPQEEEEEADPRWELVQQLLEYKKYKEAALELQQLVERQQDFLLRDYKEPAPVDSERDLEPSDKIDVWNTFNKVLRRLSDRIVKGEIQDEEISITQSMEYILNTIKTRERFRFTEVLEGKRLTVAFLVSTFLAILELTRLKRLYITQDIVFGDIECTRRDNPEDEGEDIIDDPLNEEIAAKTLTATNAQTGNDDHLAADEDADNSTDDWDDDDWDDDADDSDDEGWSEDEGDSSQTDDADDADGNDAADNADDAGNSEASAIHDMEDAENPAESPSLEDDGDTDEDEDSDDDEWDSEDVDDEDEDESEDAFFDEDADEEQQ